MEHLILRRPRFLGTSILLGAVAWLFLGPAIVTQAATYNPSIDPDDFTTRITNDHFSLPIGTKFVYEGETDDGTEVNEVTITGATKKVMGVTTLVYRDRVWLEGDLIEDTRDYLAQNDNGDVWYFGEDVDNYEDGKFSDHDGAWLAGVDGAKPGIWMLGNPKVGDTYRQEYLKGEAEDMGEVLSLSAHVTVPYGKFNNCLKTKDWTPLEPDVEEEKYYCPQVAGLVLETNPAEGERLELTDIDRNKSATTEELQRQLIGVLEKLIKALILLKDQQ